MGKAVLVLPTSVPPFSSTSASLDSDRFASRVVPRAPNMFKDLRIASSIVAPKAFSATVRFLQMLRSLFPLGGPFFPHIRQQVTVQAIEY